MTRNHQWPGVVRDVEKYVERYNLCQIIKNRTEVLVRNLMANEVPKKVWTYLTVNLITKLPLVVCN